MLTILDIISVRVVAMNGVSKVKNKHAVALGRKGGLKGGPARAKKLTPEQRSNIARKAANARWNKRDNS